MLIEESTLSKNKFVKYTIGFFLFILVSMLVLMLMPQDAGGNLRDILSGQGDASAGKVGDETIPMDYFQAARTDCYNEYQSNDLNVLNNCAYIRIRSFKIASAIAKSTGYSVSENNIKEKLSNEARMIYKQSATSAGYSKDEIESVSAIYRKILHSKPMNYWMDFTVSRSLFRNFLISNLKKSTKEVQIEEEAKNSFITLGYLSYSDEDLLKKLDSEIRVSDEDALKEYEESKKAGNLPKDDKGEIESFEKRKSFIVSKLKYDIKQKKLSELKSSLQGSLKEKKDLSLEEIASATGSVVKEIKDYALYSPATSEDKKERELSDLFQNSAFLKDILAFKEENKKIGGPYKVGEKNIYVEIKNINIDNNNANNKNSVVDNTQSLMYDIISEINQSIANVYPVMRKIGSQAQNNGN
ncbi:MAG: hypothetical protein H7A23_18605 [Leptospiraceae bacterium]|nr:hypothetical protein [Leptospiraceae bacterium]MCP5496563.1 hypothetical protein [Leptospiraceae bacterium]